MISIYGYDTANTIKIVLFMEELDTPYKFVPVNIRNGENREADFLKINPLGQVPIITDDDDQDAPTIVAESASILIYLAEKYRVFLPENKQQRAKVLEWLFFQAASCGPFFGQVEYWFQLAPVQNDVALSHYRKIALSRLSTLEQRLADNPYFGGETYSIADMAHYGWLARLHTTGLSLSGMPHLSNWMDAMEGRPAVARTRQRIQSIGQNEGG